MDRETSEYTNEEYKKVITMEDWKVRLLEEQKELKEKLVKLVAFIHSEEYYQLSENNRLLLKDQKIAMELYLNVLNIRAFEDIDKIVVPDLGFMQMMGQALSGNGFGFPKSDAVYAFKEDVKAVE